MKKHFATYNQSLALKEIGFDEPCLAFWDGKNTDAFYFNNIRDASGDYVPFQKHDRLKWFGAPLKSQVFEWFRKYRLSVVIHDLRDDYEANIIEWTLDDDKISYGFLQLFETYEEAESACIDKLIELCHDK